MSQVNDTLKLRNAHQRDANIKFFEKGHKYEITTDPKSRYTSVTTWNHSHFPKFDADAIIKNMMSSSKWAPGHKYWGLTPEQIKASWNTNSSSVASAGTDMHYEIECFNNDKRLTFDYTNKELYEVYIGDHRQELAEKSLEWQYFMNFVKDNQHLKPYRTEWLVYHEEAKIAGAIDMVYENPDGSLSIYDWKRSKEISPNNNFGKYALNPLLSHIPDTNFWHYALQLNTYKYILETKYGCVIKDLYLVRLHPDNENKNYDLIKLPILKDEMDLLFEERINKNK
jgi:PD-(D/E)XK nuclease superfamily